MTKGSLIRLLRARFDQIGHGLTFDIIVDGVRRDDSWWYVPVLATRNGKDVPREVTVNIFANIEDELQEEYDVSVLFVPATPASKAG